VNDIESERMPPPRRFFEDFVKRSFDAFRAAPHDEYLAKMAVLSANDMAERMLHHYAETARVYGLKVGQENTYRDALVIREGEAFGIVRDVAEGHKHFRLTRRAATRRVSSAEQTGAKPLHFTNDKGKELIFLNNSGGRLTFVGNVSVDLDDRSHRQLLPVLEEVVVMWDRLTAPGYVPDQVG
jgi:hypothetical protein